MRVLRTRSAAIAVLLCAVTGVGARPAAARELYAPDRMGPYSVGTTSFPATMTGGRLTTVQVFYPSSSAPDCDRKYAIKSAAGTYQVTSVHCAVEGAAVAAGQFPLVVYDHGGLGAGNDPQRFAQSPLQELLASHGIITALALHSADAATRIRDLSRLVDLLLARNQTPNDLLAGSIDPARIGVSGISAGGGAALGAASGWAAEQLTPDTRFKAMVAYEPGRVTPLEDVANISIPYLLMGGTQFRFTTDFPDVLAASTDAVPRIHVRSQNAVHSSYNSSLCPFTAETREAALLADPDLPEPLTNSIPGNPYAATAFFNWNLGVMQFPVNGPAFGGARNICNRIGVDSIRSLDVAPADGQTDSPPYLPSDEVTPAPTPPFDVMMPVLNTYTVAFWKAFLAGDGRYMRYLAPGYAATHQLLADVLRYG